MDKILDRIRKILALAGNNPNENESLAALEKAYAIMAEHNLTMAEIGEASEVPSEDEVRDSLHTDTALHERHFRWVWNACAKANMCFLFSNRPNRKLTKTIYTVVGRRINCIVATQMALYLCQTMRRCTAAEMKRSGRKDHPYKNAYIAGMAVRLCERLREMKEKAETGNALVVWSGEEEKLNRQFVEQEMGVRLKTQRVAKIRYNVAGMEKGKADADKVSLSQQLASSSVPRAAIGA
jgi:hypothetical protein